MPNTQKKETPLDPFNLHEETLEQLVKRARSLGVEMEEGDDKSDLIEAIIEASMDQVSGNTVSEAGEVETGMLFSIHSRTDEAKALIKAARNAILANEKANPPRTFSLFLRDRNQDLYDRTAPGVRVSREKLPQVLDLVSLPPNGTQDEQFEAFKNNPDGYQDPLLVRLRRRNSDGSFGTYIMLYVRKIPANTPEQVF